MIENKIFGASDQDKQLEKYGQYLKSLHIPTKILVYLATQAPSRYSLKKDSEFREITILFPCNTFINMLETTVSKIQAPKVQIFISRLIAYLRKSTMSAPCNDLVIENILSNQKHLESALQIFETFPKLVEKSLGRFIQHIHTKLKSNKFNNCIRCQHSSLEQWQSKFWHISFSFESHQSHIWKLSFECDKNNLNGFLWGICWAPDLKEDLKKEYIDLIQKMMQEVFGTIGSHTKYWPVWMWADRKISNRFQTYSSSLYSAKTLQRLAFPEEYPALLNFIMEKVKAIDRFLKEHPDYFQKASA